MKKQVIFLNIFKPVVIAIIFVGIVGCENENNNYQKVEFNANPHAKYLESKQVNQITGRTTRYTISEALEFLNDGMNYLYCRPGDVYSEGLTLRIHFRLLYHQEKLTKVI